MGTLQQILGCSATGGSPRPPQTQNMTTMGNMQPMPNMPLMPASSGAMFYPPNMLMASTDKPTESRKRTHEELTTTTATTITSVPTSSSDTNGANTTTHTERA